MSSIKRLWASPPVHFVALGLLLYVFFPPDGAQQSSLEPVVMDEARRQAVAASWAAAMGRAPGEQELAMLMQREADEEIMFREAVRFGVHVSDPVIRQRMLLNMSFLYPDDSRPEQERFEEALALELHLNDTVIRRRMIQVVELSIESDARAEPITDEDRAREYSARPDDFVVPARMQIVHAYFSRDRRDDARADAAALLVDTAALNVEKVIGSGDAFLGGNRMPTYSASQLDGQFGPGFGEAVSACAVQQWCGPVESAYGYHLVRIERREDSRRLDLEHPDVVKRLNADIARQRAERALESRLVVLRERYGVTV